MNLSYISAVFSTLFRLMGYVFLRVIPSRLGVPALPGLYVAYLISSWIWPPFPLSTVSENEKQNPEKNPPKPLNPPTRSSPLSTILFSVPTPSRSLRRANLLINTIIMLAAADLTLRPFFDPASDVIFTRVGAVYPDGAKIVVRYPGENYTAENNLMVLWRESKDKDNKLAWKDGPLLSLKEEQDWVDTVKLGNLWPSTSYEYILSTTNRTALPYPSEPLVFRTFPDPQLQSGTHFRFVVSSCITINFPYMGPLQSRTIKGFDLLAKYISPKPVAQDISPLDENSAHQTDSATTASVNKDMYPSDIESNAPSNKPSSFAPTEFLLFLGDFIYADVPLYAGDDKEAYRRLYRRNYQSESFRKVYEHLPIFHTYDDHEIINNYGGNNNDTPPYPNASDAFSIYNANANYDSPTLGQHYYDFRYGDVAFFVMDTRRYRSDIVDDLSSRTMLGDIQLAALHSWLSRVNGTSTFKFIISSVPFTSLWGHDAATDSWAGFPTEKESLLNAFHSVPNVVVLSGDRHEFAAIEYSAGTEDLHNVLEISTSPLNMFYIPFIRTLKIQSDETVAKMYIADDGSLTPTYVPKERVLKYIPMGNSKWSTIEIDTRNLSKPTLYLETIIDGKPAYTFELIGKPVKLQSSTALSAFVSNSVRDVFDKMGIINPSRWF